MQIKSREELYEYLNHMDWEAKKDTPWSSVFFLVRYNDCEEPIYFEKYEDVYFERPCALTGFRMPIEELEGYVKYLYLPEDFEKACAYESTMQLEDMHYEIHNPQTSPFLPEEFEILEVLSETECLYWLLEHNEEE